jgi:hypothetical protein
VTVPSESKVATSQGRASQVHGTIWGALFVVRSARKQEDSDQKEKNASSNLHRKPFILPNVPQLNKQTCHVNATSSHPKTNSVPNVGQLGMLIFGSRERGLKIKQSIPSGYQFRGTPSCPAPLCISMVTHYASHILARQFVARSQALRTS